MSNRRRIRQASAGRQPCAHCGRGIRPGRGVGLPGGRAVHDACAGALPRRLDCGHMGLPGMTIVREGGMFRCARCVSAETTAYLTARKG